MPAERLANSVSARHLFQSTLHLLRLQGSVGDCFDNALCESFFATLECDLLDRETFRSPAEARQEVFAFIEGWYNLRRLHSALGYLSPFQFEGAHAQFVDSPSFYLSTEPG
mgnify:CR=1 FL=1